jgi:DNA-binding IclR family transcriptional regulator
MITCAEMSRGAAASDRAGVQVVRRTAAILRALAEHPEGLSLSQIAQRVGLARSTVHRLVAALQAERFVMAVSPNGKVRLGPGLASLAIAADRDLVHELHPHLVRLSRHLNETVDLGVLVGDHVLFIDHVAAPRRLRAVSAVGAVFPAHCPANGKVLLSTLSNEELVRLLPSQLERLTPNTITSRDELLRELETVRREGVAYDREEHTVGICGLGAVIRDSRGWVGSVSVPLPAQRFYGNEQRLARELLQACEEINRALASR